MTTVGVDVGATIAMVSSLVATFAGGCGGCTAVSTGEVEVA